MLDKIRKANVNFVIHEPLIVLELADMLQLSLCILHPFHNNLLRLGAPTHQPLLQDLQGGYINKEKLTLNPTVPNLLAPLQINLQNRNLKITQNKPSLSK